MLYYDRRDATERIDRSKEFMLCHYWYRNELMAVMIYR